MRQQVENSGTGQRANTNTDKECDEPVVHTLGQTAHHQDAHNRAQANHSDEGQSRDPNFKILQ